MTVQPAAAPVAVGQPSVRRRPPRLVRELPLHIAVIGLTALWVIPTLGLFVSSFRPPHLVSTTGWWTALAPPFQFTLENYERVLTANNMDVAFLNSLTLAIPATVMPLVVAAFAAYAFSWMEFPFRDEVFLILVGL
ncbi:MAG: hypothetical protein ACRDGT_07230, partial [Candidatus Limnocylindria bacterium]